MTILAVGEDKGKKHLPGAALCRRGAEIYKAVHSGGAGVLKAVIQLLRCTFYKS